MMTADVSLQTAVSDPAGGLSGGLRGQNIAKQWRYFKNNKAAESLSEFRRS